MSTIKKLLLLLICILQFSGLILGQLTKNDYPNFEEIKTCEINWHNVVSFERFQENRFLVSYCNGLHYTFRPPLQNVDVDLYRINNNTILRIEGLYDFHEVGFKSFLNTGIFEMEVPLIYKDRHNIFSINMPRETTPDLLTKYNILSLSKQGTYSIIPKFRPGLLIHNFEQEERHKILSVSQPHTNSINRLVRSTNVKPRSLKDLLNESWDDSKVEEAASNEWRETVQVAIDKKFISPNKIFGVTVKLPEKQIWYGLVDAKPSRRLGLEYGNGTVSDKDIKRMAKMEGNVLEDYALKFCNMLEESNPGGVVQEGIGIIIKGSKNLARSFLKEAMHCSFLIPLIFIILDNEEGEHQREHHQREQRQKEEEYHISSFIANAELNEMNESQKTYLMLRLIKIKLEQGIGCDLVLQQTAIKLNWPVRTVEKRLRLFKPFKDADLCEMSESKDTNVVLNILSDILARQNGRKTMKTF